MTPVMSALFGVLAGVASLLAMMWVVLQIHKARIAHIAEHEEPDIDDLEPWWIPRHPFTTLRVSDAFDPELCMLWDSQRQALRFIYEGAERGVFAHDLALIHRRAAARYPELYDGSGFQEWVRFLEDCDLVRRRADRVFITAAGAEFVASCLQGRKAGVGRDAAA